jgi:hypothetical protein
VFLTFIFGATTAGSAVWGNSPPWKGCRSAISWRRGAGSRHSDDLALEASVARRVENNQGPVVVVVEYRVDANDRAEFLSAVDELGYARKRDGAYAWGVYEDVADGGRFIETFSIESWLEVLHQRERVTNADEMLRSRVRQLLKEAPRITLGVSPERPHRHWRKRAGEPGP